MTMFRKPERSAAEEVAARRSEGYVVVKMDNREFWAHGLLTKALILAATERDGQYELLRETGTSVDTPISWADQIPAEEGLSFYAVPYANF